MGLPRQRTARLHTLIRDARNSRRENGIIPGAENQLGYIPSHSIFRVADEEVCKYDDIYLKHISSLANTPQGDGQGEPFTAAK